MRQNHNFKQDELSKRYYDNNVANFIDNISKLSHRAHDAVVYN